MHTTYQMLCKNFFFFFPHEITYLIFTALQSRRVFHFYLHMRKLELRLSN